ncbi:MAG: hypothetical protein GY856_04630 [bacterium]|nr:hypothetical protein [bacterium]
MSSPSHDSSPSHEQVIRELVGLPRDLDCKAHASKSRVPIAEARRALDLPEPAYLELLAPDRWLAGGAVLRWLAGGFGHSAVRSGGDYDFFVPSIEALHRTLDELLARDFSFRCFRSLKIMCPLCGRPAEVSRRGRASRSTVDPIRCPECGELDVDDGDRFPAERLLRLTPELIHEHRVLAVELLSPTGDLVHLSAEWFYPHPGDVIVRFDFSVVQFGLDDEFLYSGPYAWPDLLRRRLRRDPRGRTSYSRFRKYRAMGFRPYPDTAAWYLWNVVKWRTRRLLRLPNR